MRLEIRDFPVSKIAFGSETRLDGDVLTVNRDAICKLVLQDPRIAEAHLEVAEPGTGTRVIHACDAIEPRIKVEGPGTSYPVASGSVETVGSGIVNRLVGMSVLLSCEYPRSAQTGAAPIYEAILDMSGPGALSRLSKLFNLVLILKLSGGFSTTEYHEAVQKAGYKVAEQLAETTRNRTEAFRKVFELKPPASPLPRVVYICQILSQLNLPAPFATWYGTYITDWMPFWVHPNEILDGALVPCALGGYSVKPTSWEYVNNSVLHKLYNEHGVSIDFAGVILQRTRFETVREKQLSSNQAANLAKLIKADGAMITWVSAGNAFIEGMLTAQALERLGIKTVFMTYEHGGKEGLEAPLIYSVPEADALISVGSLDRPISLPPMERVIGGDDLSISPVATERVAAKGEIQLDWYLPVLSSVDHWGFGNQVCVEY